MFKSVVSKSLAISTTFLKAPKMAFAYDPNLQLRFNSSACPSAVRPLGPKNKLPEFEVKFLGKRV